MTNNGMNNPFDIPPFFGHDGSGPVPTTGPLFVPGMYPTAGMTMATDGNRSMEQLVAPALRPGSSTGYTRRPVSQGNTAFLGYGRTAAPSLQPLAIPGTAQHLPQQGLQHGLQQGGYQSGQHPPQGTGFAMQTNPGYGQNTSAMSPYDNYASTPATAQSAFSAQDASNFHFDRRNLPVNSGSFSAGGFFGVSNGNAFGSFGNSNIAVGPVFDLSTGQTSHNPIQSFPSPVAATLMSPKLSQASHTSHTSHLSVNSAPASATVAYQTHPFPSVHARPHQMTGTTPAGMFPPSNHIQLSLLPTSPSPFPPTQDNGDMLYGVGVQNMPTTLAPSQPSPMPQDLAYPDALPCQSSTDGDVVLPEAEFSQTKFNELVEANNQYASLPVLTSFQSQTGQQQLPNQDQPQRSLQYGHAPSTRPVSRPRLPSAATATSENSFGLDSSSPLSSVSVAADSSHHLKYRSAPASAAGDVAMRNRVSGVPGSMLNNFNVGDNSHNVNNTEFSTNAKRRHSDDFEAAAGLSKKMAKGKKSDGMSCVPCAIKRKKCDNGSPCDKCKSSSAAYPVCVSQDFADHNIFLDGLRSDLKEQASKIINDGQIMAMHYPSGLGFPLWNLSEYKFGHREMYAPLLMGDPLEDKSFYKPFYQASILLQARQFLTVASKSDHPHGLEFTPELEDNLRLMQALSAVRALGFIKAMLNKNRMSAETPKHGRHALNLLIGLSMFFEQTLAFEKTHPKESLPLSDKLAAQHRDLSYHLAYRVRYMADYTYGEQSGLSKLVHIDADGVKLDEGFWDRLRSLRTEVGCQASEDHAGAEDEAMDRLGVPTAATGSGEASSSLTTPAAIGTNPVTPASADRPFIVLTRPTGLGTPPVQAPQKTKMQKVRQKLNGIRRKERERKDDDKWIDARDIPDANIIFTVRAPLHHDKFDDLLSMMQDVRLDNGEGRAGGASHTHHAHDDGTMFCTSPVGDDMQWPSDVGSPSDIFDGLDLSTGSINNSVALDGTGGDNLGLDGLYSMDGLDDDNVLADSLRAAQDADDADPRFDYGTTNAVLHPDLVADPNTASPRTPGHMPGPSVTDAATAAPAAGPSVSSAAPSESGSASCHPSSNQSSLLPARSQSMRRLVKGKDAVKKLFSRNG